MMKDVGKPYNESMEEEKQSCNYPFLDKFTLEQQTEINDTIKEAGIPLDQFLNHLESSNWNNKDSNWPFKRILNEAKTSYNKDVQKEKIEKRLGCRTFNLLDMIKKLCAGKQGAQEPGRSEKYGGGAIKSWNDEFQKPDEKCMNVELEIHSNLKEYKHWNLSQQNRIDSLDKQFNYLMQCYKSEMNIEEFSDLGQMYNNDVTIVGRLVNTDLDLDFKANVEIVNYSESNDGRKKMKLNLDQIEQPCTIFEGQVVVVNGTSSDPAVFDAKTIENLPLLKPERVNSSMESGSCQVCVFCGPYTSKEALDYVHLRNVANEIRESRPQVAILGGPFLDCEHELVKEGELLFTNKDNEIDCFEDGEVLKALKNYLIDLSRDTKIILVPSLNDMTSLHPFPQPPLSKEPTENLKFLSNPARFSINGIDFGVINSELIRHLISKSEMFGDSNEHKLTRCIREFVKQRNFYPTYPPRENVSIDISRCCTDDDCVNYDMPTAPDVLISFSELPPFVGDVDSKVAYCNPGLLHKMKTYAVITLNCDSSAQELTDKVKMEIKSL